MTKTVIRGAWPGKPAPKHLTMKPIKETYAPPDKNFHVRGKSAYAPYIDHIMSGKPGTMAIECSDQKAAKGLIHALSRYLQQRGLYDAMRPRYRKDAEDCHKVWVVPVDEKAQ
jgi:hypothetical protein